MEQRVQQQVSHMELGAMRVGEGSRGSPVAGAGVGTTVYPQTPIRSDPYLTPHIP